LLPLARVLLLLLLLVLAGPLISTLKSLQFPLMQRSCWPSCTGGAHC
jgi:hypothetical protein